MVTDREIDVGEGRGRQQERREGNKKQKLSSFIQFISTTNVYAPKPACYG
jgi:hypothetical protein